MTDKELTMYEFLKQNIGKEVKFLLNSSNKRRFFDRLHGVLKIDSKGIISADCIKLYDPNNKRLDLVYDIELVEKINIKR